MAAWFKITVLWVSDSLKNMGPILDPCRRKHFLLYPVNALSGYSRLRFLGFSVAISGL